MEIIAGVLIIALFTTMAWDAFKERKKHIKQDKG